MFLHEDPVQVPSHQDGAEYQSRPSCTGQKDTLWLSHTVFCMCPSVDSLVVNRVWSPGEEEEGEATASLQSGTAFLNL